MSDPIDEILSELASMLILGIEATNIDLAALSERLQQRSRQSFERGDHEGRSDLMVGATCAAIVCELLRLKNQSPQAGDARDETGQFPARLRHRPRIG